MTSVHRYDTKQDSNGDIFMTQGNALQHGLRSRYAGAKSWNNIPSVIKQSATVTHFHTKIKLDLFSIRYQR